MTLSQGEVLQGRYRVVKKLGEGGFGAVYQAWDINLECHRAVKENLDISIKAQHQFKFEAKILNQLSHPNLPRVIDHFIIAGQGQYLVMDYVEGQDLALMLQNGPLPESRVLPWIIQVCDALSYLHAQTPPVIHRDIKPENIKITPEGKAMLVDFGISKIYDPALSTTMGARAITPGYSPPEQYGQGSTDARSDLYALGATLYHLLTGQMPPDSVDIITQSSPPPPPVNDLNASVSTHTGDVILRAMALDRDARWQTANDFKQAITTTPIAGNQHVDPYATKVNPPKKLISLTPTKAGYSWLNKIGSLSWGMLVIALALIVLISICLFITIEVIGRLGGEATPSTAAVVGATTQPVPGIDTNTPKPASQTPISTDNHIPTMRKPVYTDTYATIDLTFEVFANQNWQNTGIYLHSGNNVKINYLSGKWTYWSGEINLHDANGPYEEYICSDYIEATSCVEPIPDYNKGALIGRVNEQLFKIGNNFTFSIFSNGNLELRINDDDDGLFDNTGSIKVRIEVE